MTEVQLVSGVTCNRCTDCTKTAVGEVVGCNLSAAGTVETAGEDTLRRTVVQKTLERAAEMLFAAEMPVDMTP